MSYRVSAATMRRSYGPPFDLVRGMHHYSVVPMAKLRVVTA